MEDLLVFFCFFRRFMNQYFLLIACLQLWSLITPVNPASTWGPLIIIFAVSATKEAWDDYNRYISDKQANEKEVWIVKNGSRKHVCSFVILFII
jgi:phospholipid-translocating ATPase